MFIDVFITGLHLTWPQSTFFLLGLKLCGTSVHPGTKLNFLLYLISYKYNKLSCMVGVEGGIRGSVRVIDVSADRMFTASWAVEASAAFMTYNGDECWPEREFWDISILALCGSNFQSVLLEHLLAHLRYWVLKCTTLCICMCLLIPVNYETCVCVCVCSSEQQRSWR